LAKSDAIRYTNWDGWLVKNSWMNSPNGPAKIRAKCCGRYLHCQKRLSDAGPLDLIWFEDAKRERLEAFLATEEVAAFLPALERTSAVIDGFESPLGMELLATVDWLVLNGTVPTTSSVREALIHWPGGSAAGQRKRKLFDDRLVDLAVARLTASALSPVSHDRGLLSR